MSVLDIAPVASSTADVTSGVETYAITISGGTDTNYDFVSVGNDGALTITRAKLTVIANDQSIKQGESIPIIQIL